MLQATKKSRLCVREKEKEGGREGRKEGRC
jgi:hypothetical protein